MIKAFKFTLNSSIGTKDFRPLDKIINEANMLVPSTDFVLGRLEKFSFRPDEEKRITINAVVDGGCYLTIELESSLYLDIYINNEHSNESQLYGQYLYFIPFYFKKGDIIEFSFRADSANQILRADLMGGFKKRNALVEVSQ